jgi:O-antigen/teichoic acid export membrane protein
VCANCSLIWPSVNIYPSIGRIYFQYSKKPIPISVISAISGIIAVLGNYIFIVELKWGYLGLFAGQFFAGLFSFLIYIWIVYGTLELKPDYAFSFIWIKKKLNISIPTIPHYYAGYILNISDRILLVWLNVPLEKIGVYSFAYSFGNYFSIIGKAWQQASGPFYMENNRKENIHGDLKNKKLTDISQLGILIFAFLIVLFLPEIFDLLVRNE